MNKIKIGDVIHSVFQWICITIGGGIVLHFLKKYW